MPILSLKNSNENTTSREAVQWNGTVDESVLSDIECNEL